ncbi:MAG: efflux RND transporter permease subunit, partial [Candidatus Aminicenantes bacterium]|nr:efflux RND transporter permease subunit [Candidatus Aminicenantes bacterium]
LNIMTLGGLALGIGMLVDNSIVVLENIVRLKDGGTAPRQAAHDGTREVAAAVLASTLTTICVFMPMVFVRGVAGIMFKQLAFVVSFSLICSLVVALTLVPMLSSRLLSPSRAPRSRLETWKLQAVTAIRRRLAALESRYQRLLHWALDHRVKVVLTVAVLLAGSIALVGLVGSEFMPTTDEGEVRLSVEMEVGTRLAVLDEKFKEIAAIVRREVPELVSIEESFGGGGWRSGSHTGDFTVKLPTRSQRSRSSDEVAMALRRALQGIPGVVLRVRAGGGFFFMRGAGGQDRVQVEVRGFDLEKSDALGQQVKKVVEGVRGVSDVRLSRDLGMPEELLLIDRQKAADMKLSVSQIGGMLETVLSGTQASTFREGGDEFRILVKVKNAEALTMDDILDLTLTNGDGQGVSLRNVVSVRPRSGPQRIERRDRERVLTISSEIEDRDLASVLDDIRSGLRRIPIPRGFEVAFTGDFEEQQKAFLELLVSIILALLLVYMVMAMQFESVRDPFIVMFSVPLAVIGVVWMLLITGTTFNMQSYIGCIMLGGIVVNNAILLVDHTNLLRRRDGMRVREAIEEAGRRRLRPILMTASTTILAMMPLAMGLKEGSEAQAPMARAVVGGLLSSSLITLLVVPVVYSFFEGKKDKA